MAGRDKAGGKAGEPSRGRPGGGDDGRRRRLARRYPDAAELPKLVGPGDVTPAEALKRAPLVTPQTAPEGEQGPELNGATRPDVFGFKWMPDGLYRIPADSNKTPFRVCGPFEVVALTRPEAGDEWGGLLRWHDRDGRCHEWIMPFRLLAGEAVEVRARLAACGLPVGAHDGAQRALKEYLASIVDRVEARVRTVPRTGWYRPAPDRAVFVLPGRTIGASAGEEVRLDLDQAPGIYRERGTLEEWQSRVAVRCVGNSRLAFAVSAGLAGPIIGLLEEEGGGFNFRGGSSRGKTSCIDAAASVWGAPSKTGPDSFTRTWRSTDNAMEGTAAAHNDCILPLDELGQADPVTLPETLYMLAHGAGKARARAGGGNRTGTTWRTLVLSSSEESAARLMQQAKRRIKAGQEIRMLDIPAEVPGGHGVFEVLQDAPDGASFAQALRGAVLEQHGTAGPAFVEDLARMLEFKPDYIAQVVAPMVKRWIAERDIASADGQVQRAARRFALVAAAGELASKAKITGWPAGEAARAAAVVFRAWLDERGGSGSREDHHLFAAFRRYFVEHGQARFAAIHAPKKKEVSDMASGAEASNEQEAMEKERIVMHRAGWRWPEALTPEEKEQLATAAGTGDAEAGAPNFRWAYGLAPEVFEAEIAGPLGMEKNDALARLGAAGLIAFGMEGKEKRWAFKVRRIPGVGRPRLIVPTPRALEED